jgi:hypothetical protein
MPKVRVMILMYLAISAGVAGSLRAVTWSRYGTAPVLTADSGVDMPVVLQVDGTYHIWYQRFFGTSIGTAIWHATSTDGRNWTGLESTPVFSYRRDSSPGTVVHDANGFRMWYSFVDDNAHTQIGYATSPNGIQWVDCGQVVATGEAGTYDSTFAGLPSVVYDASTGVYLMWYDAEDDDGGMRAIALATSSDGITWTKYGIVLSAQWGTWYSDGVSRACVVKSQSQYVMYFGGQSSDGIWTIGQITSSDGANWDTASAQMVLGVGSSGAWDDGFVYEPWVTSQPDGLQLIYYSGWRNTGASVGSVGLAVETIVVGPPIVVKSPVGGETWPSGTFQSISWTKSQDIAAVKIEYSIDAGGSWNLMTERAAGTTWLWAPPSVRSSQCLIRVSDADHPGVSSVSDACFQVFECQLTSRADLNGDCRVDFADMATMASERLACDDPSNTAAAITARNRALFSIRSTRAIGGESTTGLYDVNEFALRTARMTVAGPVSARFGAGGYQLMTIDNQRGVILGINTSGALCASTDGVTWTTLCDIHTTEPMKSFYDDSTSNSIHAVVVTSTGAYLMWIGDSSVKPDGVKACCKIYRSTDAGTGWTEVYSSYFPTPVWPDVLGQRIVWGNYTSISSGVDRWTQDDRNVYISEDDGLTWHYMARDRDFADPGAGSGRHVHSCRFDGPDRVWVTYGDTPYSQVICYDRPAGWSGNLTGEPNMCWTGTVMKPTFDVGAGFVKDGQLYAGGDGHPGRIFRFDRDSCTGETMLLVPANAETCNHLNTDPAKRTGPYSYSCNRLNGDSGMYGATRPVFWSVGRVGDVYCAGGLNWNYVEPNEANRAATGLYVSADAIHWTRAWSNPADIGVARIVGQWGNTIACAYILANGTYVPVFYSISSVALRDAAIVEKGYINEVAITNKPAASTFDGVTILDANCANWHLEPGQMTGSLKTGGVYRVSGNMIEVTTGQTSPTNSTWLHNRSGAKPSTASPFVTMKLRARVTDGDSTRYSISLINSRDTYMAVQAAQHFAGMNWTDIIGTFYVNQDPCDSDYWIRLACAGSSYVVPYTVDIDMIDLAYDTDRWRGFDFTPWQSDGSARDDEYVVVPMPATKVSDGVEYMFTCVSGGGHSSGWQTGTTYVDSALLPYTTYTYTVQARDLSGIHGETAVSAPAIVVTSPASESIPPTPDPMSFATLPYAVSSTSIAMTAATATDTSGVEYMFTCTAGGGHSSAWQANPNYVDTGLSPSTAYSYTVKARDLSTSHNETSSSSVASATTQVSIAAPSAYWTLDESAGTVAHDFVGTSDGALTGTTLPAWTAGTFGNCLSFVTNGGRVYVPSNSAIDSSTGGLSISLWLKEPASFSGQQEIVIKGTIGAPGSGKRYEIYRKNTNFRFAVDDDVIKSELSLATTNFATDRWVHVVAVRDAVARQLRLYANGVLQGSVADRTGSISQTEGLYIGDTTMAGSIDDVRVYQYALTTAQIGAIYNGADLPDMTAPTPATMSFAVAPHAIVTTSISMTAATASDVSGVQYMFTCVSGGGHSSAWQTSPTYTDTGLTPSISYTYTVKARDLSSRHNETASSAEASATTPALNAATFAMAPYATSSTSVSMVASTVGTNCWTVVFDWQPLNGSRAFACSLPICSVTGPGGKSIDLLSLAPTTAAGKVYLRLTDGVNNATTTRDYRWLHWDDIKVAITSDGASSVFYVYDPVNGLVTTSAGSVSLSNVKAETLKLGANGAGNVIGTGVYTNIRTFGRQLTSTEVTQLFGLSSGDIVTRADLNDDFLVDEGDIGCLTADWLQSGNPFSEGQ